MKEIIITHGYKTIVDADMFDFLNQFRWHASEQRPNVKHKMVYVKKHYTIRKGKYRKFGLHHVVIGFPINGFVVDHINGNPLDNRRANLRIVTARENGLNRIEKRDGRKSSQYPNVYWNKDKRKWQAYMKIDGQLKYLGRYDDENDAYKKVLSLLKQKP